MDLSSLTGMFVGLHVVVADSLKVPELSLSMEEGTQFMKSAQNVLRHYSVETTQKTLDWIAFGGTICMIYGTRFGAYMLRKRSETKPRIVPFPSRRPNDQQPGQPQEQTFTVEPEFEDNG